MRLFAALDEAGTVLAYVSFSPVYGMQSGWLHDLSRRRPDAPPGVLELIVVKAIETRELLQLRCQPARQLCPQSRGSGGMRFLGVLVGFLLNFFDGARRFAVDLRASRGKLLFPLFEGELSFGGNGLTGGFARGGLNLLPGVGD